MRRAVPGRRGGDGRAQDDRPRQPKVHALLLPRLRAEVPPGQLAGRAQMPRGERRRVASDRRGRDKQEERVISPDKDRMKYILRLIVVA